MIWGDDRGPVDGLPTTELSDRRLGAEERRGRWAVRAAQWRAYELAEAVFGAVTSSGVVGLRSEGPARGLLRLDVPFDDLDAHLDREARFMSAAEADPVLSQVPLVYVFGPAVG